MITVENQAYEGNEPRAGVVDEYEPRGGTGCGYCLGFWVGVFLVLTLAGVGATLYCGFTYVVPFIMERSWLYSTQSLTVVELYTTDDQVPCDCAPHAGIACLSFYPCLTVKVTPNCEGCRGMYNFYLTREDFEKRGQHNCYYNPNKTCHENSRINEVIVETYKRQLDGEVFNFYYYSEDHIGEFLQNNDRMDQFVVLVYMVPPAAVTCVCLIVFLVLAIYSCARRSGSQKYT